MRVSEEVRGRSERNNKSEAVIPHSAARSCSSVFSFRDAPGQGKDLRFGILHDIRLRQRTQRLVFTLEEQVKQDKGTRKDALHQGPVRGTKRGRLRTHTHARRHTYTYTEVGGHEWAVVSLFIETAALRRKGDKGKQQQPQRKKTERSKERVEPLTVGASCCCAC